MLELHTWRPAFIETGSPSQASNNAQGQHQRARRPFEHRVRTWMRVGHSRSILSIRKMVGPPRFELGTSCPPDKRANQAAPQPVTVALMLTVCVPIQTKRTMIRQPKYAMSAVTRSLKCHGVFSSSDSPAASLMCLPPLGQSPLAVIAVGVKYRAHSSHHGISALLLSDAKLDRC